MARSYVIFGKNLQHHNKILQNFWQDFTSSWQDLKRYSARFYKIMARSCVIFGKILQDHGKILQDFWQDFTRSWQDLTRFYKSWEDLANFG